MQNRAAAVQRLDTIYTTGSKREAITPLNITLTTMTLPSILLCLVFVCQALGATFLFPGPTDSWTTTGPNFISWTYNSGEPRLVNLQLLYKNNDTFKPIPNLLTSQGIFAPAININESMMLFTPA
ncbi:hypothetical protein PILCRDRAFT_728503 [Piloderma croceum F 1598]|uniref:Uncharacterized protein n=1 Tax=Piloderma croceum (strain F 1598) TaxID=765440 RepID=A0A0C3EZT8_PILCF|nr:hypothetical protein PILCRDRAFT_728503 [Piloderma croceum F 1598]